MTTETVNVSEETKKFMDAIADVMDYTQDRAVQIALYKLCPVNNWQNMSFDELKMAIAKHQSQRMRFSTDRRRSIRKHRHTQKLIVRRIRLHKSSFLRY